jgi:tetratricopeptide (TPR) repeat protein
LIGDFLNRTGDPFFDYTVTQLLTIAMQESRAFAVYPRSQTIETLARMQRSIEDLNEEVLKEVAVRSNLATVISGEVDRTPDGFRILLRAVDPRTDGPQAVLTQSLSDKDRLPSAVDLLFAALQRELGGGPQAMTVRVPPLPEVTTTSIEALERFSQALALRAQGRVSEAVTLLKSAVEIDPDFGMAHSQLAIGQSSSGDREAALVSAARAFDLRHGVGERERYLIAATYHFLRAEFREAQESYRSVALLYPGDAYAFRYLMQVETERGAYENAIEAATRLRELDPENSFDRQITVVVLAEAGQFDEALAGAEAARAGGVTGSTLAYGEGLARLGQDRLADARQAFGEFSVGPGGNAGRLYTSQSLIYEGQLEQAARSLESDLVLDPGSGAGRFAGARRYWLAEIYRLLNQKEKALAHARILAAGEPSPTRLHQLRTAGLLYARVGERELARGVVERLERFQASSSSEVVSATIEQLRGELAWQEGRAGEARNRLQRANALWPFPSTTWSLATFLEGQGEHEQALALYDEIIRRKGHILRWDPASLWVLAHLHASRCLEALGRFPEASRYRDTFFALWARLADRFVRDSSLSGRLSRNPDGLGALVADSASQ